MEEDKNSKTVNFKFILYQWGDKGANGEWKQMAVERLPPATDTVFVDKTQQWVYMAYSEYQWSAEMFERLEADEKIRQSMMTKVNVDSKEKTQNSAPFEMLSDLVVEFTNDQTLINIGKNAFTGIQKAFKTPTLCGEKEKGLVVALEDTIGEMRELQDILYKLVDAKTTYYEEYSYPLTIGHLIDPKVVYDVQGKKCPLENNQRIIEQPAVRKVLSKDFSRYTKLVSDSYHKFDMPRQAIIEQLSGLKRREPLRVLLTELMPDLLKKLNLEPENTAGLDRTSYVFCRTVADICIGFENTPRTGNVIYRTGSLQRCN
ncbi:toxin VasX [Rodentibacter ratti]|uniref:toxin VasX n=1 Tax=Rodentibacter ratti TaxID=1906745 RepID=UPI0021197A0B|nr:toxin VasX [Rodentibacter ratti]